MRYLILLLSCVLWQQAMCQDAKPLTVSDLRDLQFDLLQELSPLEKSTDFNRILFVQNVDSIIRVKRMLNIAQLLEISIPNMESKNDQRFLRVTLQEAIFFIKVDIREQRTNWNKFRTYAKTAAVQKYIGDLLASFDKIESYDTSDYEKAVKDKQGAPRQ